MGEYEELMELRERIRKELNEESARIHRKYRERQGADNPFHRRGKDESFWYINVYGIHQIENEDFLEFSNVLYERGNYCGDITIMGQRALHERLSRLLWQFAGQRDGEPTEYDWHCSDVKKWYLGREEADDSIGVCCVTEGKIEGVQYFKSEETAKMAMFEVVGPFLHKNVSFKW